MDDLDPPTFSEGVMAEYIGDAWRQRRYEGWKSLVVLPMQVSVNENAVNLLINYAPSARPV